MALRALLHCSLFGYLCGVGTFVNSERLSSSLFVHLVQSDCCVGTTSAEGCLTHFYRDDLSHYLLDGVPVLLPSPHT